MEKTLNARLAEMADVRHLVDVLNTLDFGSTMTLTIGMVERLAPEAVADDIVRAAMNASCIVCQSGRTYRFEKVRIQRH